MIPARTESARLRSRSLPRTRLAERAEFRGRRRRGQPQQYPGFSRGSAGRALHAGSVGTTGLGTANEAASRRAGSVNCVGCFSRTCPSVAPPFRLWRYSGSSACCAARRRRGLMAATVRSSWLRSRGGRFPRGRGDARLGGMGPRPRSRPRGRRGGRRRRCRPGPCCPVSAVGTLASGGRCAVLPDAASSSRCSHRRPRRRAHSQTIEPSAEVRSSRRECASDEEPPAGGAVLHSARRGPRWPVVSGCRGAELADGTARLRTAPSMSCRWRCSRVARTCPHSRCRRRRWRASAGRG